MTDAREAFLSQVRSAVAAGNVAGQGRELPTGPRVGYQGGGANLVQSFADGLRAAGGQCHIVHDPKQAVEHVIRLVSDAKAKTVTIEASGALARLQLGPSLRLRGFDAWEVSESSEEGRKERLFAADVGVTGVDWLIAETGSIVLATGANRARSASLLPPVHIAVAERAQIIPDLFDLYDASPLSPLGRGAGREGLQLSNPSPRPSPQRGEGDGDMPACLTIITGPSKTGDIELRLVTGVHGPGEVHVVLIDS